LDLRDHGVEVGVKSPGKIIENRKAALLEAAFQVLELLFYG